MAQVIIHYTGHTPATGDVRYIRSSPGGSGILQLARGATVWMYNLDLTDGHYRTFAPASGYIRQWDLEDITPTFQTVTDPCTPPSAVTLNTSAKVLTITGGGGGDLNTLEGWGVSWRDQRIGTGSWGAWSADMVTGSRTLAVTAPAGYLREFRVRTRGSAGESYFSAYVTCPTLLSGNTAPGAPTVLRPTAGAVSHSATPAVVLSCPADPEGDAMTLKRQVDSGAWQGIVAVPGGGGMVKDRLPALGAGAHTVRYTLADAHGLEGPVASVTLTVSPAAWGRAISAGSIIANGQISHRADIQELRNAVNVQRAYYGLGAMALPGTAGAFADWKRQMAALQTAIGEALAAAGVAAPAWLAVPGWPTAGVINQIRVAVGLV